MLIAMTTSFTSLNTHSYAFHENLGIDDNKASELYHANPNDPPIVRWKNALQSAIDGMDKCFYIQQGAISCQSLISTITNCKSHPNTLLACNDARLAQYPLILQKALEAEKNRLKFEECMEKGGNITTCKIKLNSTISPYSNLTGNSSSDRPYIGIIGLSLTPYVSKQIGLNQTKGFLLTSITKGSPAEKYGLKGGYIPFTYNGRVFDAGGDVILKIDNQSVSNIDDIMSYVKSQKHIGDKVNFTILRDNATRELDLILGNSLGYTLNAIGQSQQELYDQCVRVAGKSLCDFLFKK
jgi:hypothetical protein